MMGNHRTLTLLRIHFYYNQLTYIILERKNNSYNYQNCNASISIRINKLNKLHVQSSQ